MIRDRGASTKVKMVVILDRLDEGTVQKGSTMSKNMKTRVTELFGITYPIIQGGMIWISGWKLAGAVSRAGGLGLLGAGSMDSRCLARHVGKLQDSCSQPFGVNIPVAHPESEAFVDICIRSGVKIVFTSAGSPGKFTDQLKDAEVIVVHVVPSTKLALKVEAAGCHAVVAEGTEAGGHNGFEEITSLNLWPAVADAVEIPVIAAGGIADGRGMAAAFALGAECVQLGSRFAVTEESSASPQYKEAVLKAGEADARLYLRRLMPTRALMNAYLGRAVEAEDGGATGEELLEFRGHGRTRKGIFEGDLNEGELEVGQAAGRIDELLPASEVITRMVSSYRRIMSGMPQT